MKKTKSFTFEDIDKKLRYDSGTGDLFWKESPVGSVKKGEKAGNKNKNGYVKIQVNKKSYPAHWIAWLLYYRKWPKKSLDHVNRNRSDNRIKNLREATQRENSRNSFHGPGVHKSGKKWRATISTSRKRKWLGTYKTKKEALKVRKEAEKKYYKNFAPIRC